MTSQARHVHPAGFLETRFAADAGDGLKEMVPTEFRRASGGHGAPVDGLGEHGREEGTGVLRGGQGRAGFLAVDQTADLVDGVAAVLGQ